jgi:hypothetical protein
MNDTRVRRAFDSRAAASLVLFTAFTSGCDANTITNNYFSSPAPVADAGDAGRPDAAVIAPSSAVETTSATTEAGGETSQQLVTSSEPGASSQVLETEGWGSGGATQPESSTLVSYLDAGSVDASVGPLVEGAPVVNSTPDELGLDVFGTNQNRYWFVATQQQIDAINEEFQGGNWYGGNDIYAPTGGALGKRTVDHLLVTTPDGKTADFGEMQVKLVGQSSGRPWTDQTLPNFKIDSDDVTPNLRLGGYEHLRFNNAIVGTIYREKFIYDYYQTLGYPAPRSTYGWVSTTAWAPDVAVPYIVVESYKRGFCRERSDYFGGECPNMWEFASDMGWGVFDIPENCQFESCDSTRANQFEDVVVQAQSGLATVDDVGQYVDWERFHQFQCLSWIFGTGDDAIHGGNNTVWVERPDGKFQLLPYSIDISLGFWNPGLDGYTTVASICQNDAGCWADTIEVCEGLVDAFIAADPVARIDALHEELDDAGMIRAGDEQRQQELRSVLRDLVTNLPSQLEQYRDNPWGPQYCSFPQVECGGYCQYPANCYLCQDWYYEQGSSGDTYDYVTASEDVMTTAPSSDATVIVTTAEGVATAMGGAADIALPGPGVTVPPPPAAPPPPPGDGGVVTQPDGSGYPKPDFCYWDYGYYGYYRP